MTGIRRENKISNDTKHLNPQCKIVVYDWVEKELGESTPNSVLSKTTQLDISSQVMRCSYGKNMGEPTGNFQFTLSNSPGISTGDWKDLIKRGSWCVIYMSQEGDLTMNPQVGPPLAGAQKVEEAKKIRCIGFIDRVAVSSEINDKGAFDVTYEVSGRDFGVIYEDTSLWHNVFQYERIMLDALGTSDLNILGATKIDEAMKVIHNLFFNPSSVPGANVNNNNSLTQIALQWLLPEQMLRDIGFTVAGNTFWGALPGITKFSPTEAGLAIEKPTDYLSGNAWDNLLQLATPHFHELYTETDDNGLPALIFRPIPFAIDKTRYPTVGLNVQLYKDIKEIVEVPALDVINFNLGEDNHARYNSFLVTIATTMINTEDNISLLQGSGFPKNIQDSIKRHGFRPMHITVDSIVKNAERGDGKSNPRILREFNELLLDYWENAVFSESGSANLIGNNLIKIGKVMKFGPDTPYVDTKRYYIEGYSDQFMIDEKGAATWIVDVNLTRGFEEEDLRQKGNFGTRETQFAQEGEYTPSGSASTQKNRK